MNSQEIIREDVQRERGGKVGFLLGKARRQARESSHPRSQRQITAFDMRGRDHVGIRSSSNDCAFDALELTRTIPLAPTLNHSVVLDLLREVNVCPEGLVSVSALASPLRLVRATMEIGLSLVKSIVHSAGQFWGVIYLAHENHQHGRGGETIERDGE